MESELIAAIETRNAVPPISRCNQLHIQRRAGVGEEKSAAKHSGQYQFIKGYGIIRMRPHVAPIIAREADRKSFDERATRVHLTRKCPVWLAISLDYGRDWKRTKPRVSADRLLASVDAGKYFNCDALNGAALFRQINAPSKQASERS